MDEPDLQLFKFVSSDKSPVNYAHIETAVLDDLYEKQSRTTDAKERLKLLRQFEKPVLETSRPINLTSFGTSESSRITPKSKVGRLLRTTTSTRT